MSQIVDYKNHGVDFRRSILNHSEKFSHRTIYELRIHEPVR